MGLIPAHAGKTETHRLTKAEMPAHPRSRGENNECTVNTISITGSSPLTRGKQAETVRAALSRGLIPAHAGKTGVAKTEKVTVGAHPRSRGENPGCETVRPLTAGSSPLTRGKHAAGSDGGGRSGLIPAHAGKTSPSISAMVA